MTAKVYFYTFPKPDYQGKTIPLGVIDTEVTIQREQVTVSRGCTSSEITSDWDVPTVKVNGRRFICAVALNVILPPDIKADYAVAIPWDLAEQLKRCPHCKGLL